MKLYKYKCDCVQWTYSEQHLICYTLSMSTKNPWRMFGNMVILQALWNHWKVNSFSDILSKRHSCNLSLHSKKFFFCIVFPNYSILYFSLISSTTLTDISKADYFTYYISKEDIAVLLSIWNSHFITVISNNYNIGIYRSPTKF